MSHYQIEVKGVTYIYPGGGKAVDDVSFGIAAGESVGLLGANGAGKSTMLLLLMGILEPASGELFVGDVKMSKKTLPSIRKKLGLVFQNPDDQLFMPTIYDDVAFAPRNAGLAAEEVEKRVKDALYVTGISHLADRAPFRCSGGEKRAAAFAGVISMQPDALIMDEPTSDLDPKARRNAIELLSKFTQTKIIATHDIDMVYDLCERTIILQNGQIKADGKTKDIVTNAELMNEYGLELPLSVQHCPICGKKS